MSKSLGNLVFVSRLLEAGHDPMALRLALLAHHYRTDWDWTDAGLVDATEQLATWRRAAAAAAGSLRVRRGSSVPVLALPRVRAAARGTRSWPGSGTGWPMTWTRLGRWPWSTSGPRAHCPARRPDPGRSWPPRSTRFSESFCKAAADARGAVEAGGAAAAR